MAERRDLLFMLLVARQLRPGSLFGFRLLFEDRDRRAAIDECARRGWLAKDATLTPEGERLADAHRAAIKEWRYEALPRTRADAVLIKAPAYFTGQPCKKGHVAPRLARNWTCCVCSQAFWRWRSGAA